MSHHFMYRTMNQSICQFYKIFVHISKCLACKDITAEDNKKRMIITLYIYIYAYAYIICDKNDSSKIDSINSILQHGRVADKNCCVVFPTSTKLRSSYEGSYHLISYKD